MIHETSIKTGKQSAKADNMFVTLALIKNNTNKLRHTGSLLVAGVIKQFDCLGLKTINESFVTLKCAQSFH